MEPMGTELRVGCRRVRVSGSRVSWFLAGDILNMIIVNPYWVFL